MKLQFKYLITWMFAIVLLIYFFSFVSSYDSGWQNWRTKSNYIVCGGSYQKCSNSLLGVDWFKEIPKENQNSAKYGLICGERSSPYGCLHWGGAAIGRSFSLNNGNYYLLIKNYFDNGDPQGGEEFKAAISNNFGENGRKGIDLGGGYKTCVFSQPFQGNQNSKVWISGPKNSFNSVQFRITSCIPNETSLVYCENGQPAVSNCPPICAPEIVFTSWSNWQKIGCVENQTQERRERVEYDKNNCGTFQNRTQYEYRLVGPNYVNTSWSSWRNNGCYGANLLQVRNLTQYDAFGCASSQIFYEYRIVQANTVFTPWSDWQNLQCINSTHRNQSRFRTEYDANNLGCFQNRTYYEYRTIADSNCYFCTPINGGWSSTLYGDWGSCINNQRNRTLMQICNNPQPNECGLTCNTTQGWTRINATTQIRVETENCWVQITPPNITIISPRGNYTSSNITLNVTSNQRITNWTYSIDGNQNISINNTNSFNLTVLLANLQNGPHNIFVCGTNTNGTSCDFSEFLINSTTENINNNQTSISVVILSPLNNTTYNKTSIIINATSNVTANFWSYKLNNDSEVFFYIQTQNFVYNLTNLTNGNYGLIVCGYINNSVKDCKTINFGILLFNNQNGEENNNENTPRRSSPKSGNNLKNDSNDVIFISKTNYTEKDVIVLNNLSYSKEYKKEEIKFSSLILILIIGIIILIFLILLLRK